MTVRHSVMPLHVACGLAALGCYLVGGFSLAGASIEMRLWCQQPVEHGYGARLC